MHLMSRALSCPTGNDFRTHRDTTMRIHLVAIDLDGTLLNSAKEVTDTTAAILTAARQQGVHIVLATARPPRSVMPTYDRLDLDLDDPVAVIDSEFDQGLEGVTEEEVRQSLAKIERTLGEWSKGRKFYGHMFDDILKLKYYHQRYTNYLKWLRWKD